ncbi:hypothetical protein G7Y89_g5 [Cudoniella acicularis]|uniref:tRNA pseudouridine synthase 1 n=1 Tax=Cudoniella acicularis TaxID=354080 RepID=A0A8H4W8P5_9HELO|nr:hypothetical protein G7Y89_g5 [Cudoniella acicularis]
MRGSQTFARWQTTLLQLGRLGQVLRVPVARIGARPNHTRGIRGGAEGKAVEVEEEIRAVGGTGASVRIIREVVTKRRTWGVANGDKRKRNEEEQAAKRLRTGAENEYATTQFSKEEIEAEGRKPKRKVAVLIGYAGSGYKGMQINGNEKTIEGDIFKAFVAAGAISKANADDPKKSSLVRCARTDKGVHAAGNVISLKLIVEEPDIVQKINEHLPPQIRIWGMERTNGSFSCYQTCDSRWYEYLIPTYSFIPPHPKSFMGKKLVESAEKEGVLDQWRSRQEDAADFWEKAETEYVKPILDKLDPEMQEAVMALIHSSVDENEPEVSKKKQKQAAKAREAASVQKSDSDGSKSNLTQADEAIDSERGPSMVKEEKPEDIVDTSKSSDSVSESARRNGGDEENLETKNEAGGEVKNKDEMEGIEVKVVNDVQIKKEEGTEASKSILTPLDVAVKEIKAAYIAAKKAYRISDYRRQRVQDALSCYIGTRNFHNYTIQKTFLDPSAKRVIRSFKVGPTPVIINDTEWLSLKVHGQSFMMHQIRKMVATAALVVRCGTELSIIQESYGQATISIPKAPGLGLLLERPVFDTYNEQAKTKYEREKIDFDKFQKEMDEFKQREIYDRIFREEEKDHQFHTFFHHIDHYRTDYFLWVTAEGISAARQSKVRAELMEDDNASDNEPDANGEEG